MNASIYLTTQEMTVFRMLTQESMTAQEVALALGLSKRTVQDYAAHVRNKLEVHSIMAAYNKAMRMGLLDPPPRDPPTKVINISTAPDGWKENPAYVYIGRTGKGMMSCFGNSYIIGKNGTREEVIALYRTWLENQIEHDADFRAMVAALKGKILVCFCAPEACHGDVLAEWAEKLG